MKKLLIPVAVFCCFLVLGNPAKTLASDIQVMLKVVTGLVEMQVPGEETWTQIEDKTLLSFDDQVRTGPNGRARLLYSDSSMLKLKENTLAQIGRGELRVLVGQAWVRVIKKGTHFQVVTPTLIAGVKGTVFDVAVGPRGRSQVRTYSGLVAVEAGGEEVVLDPGYITHSDGGPPSAPAPFDSRKESRSWRFSKVDMLRDKVYPIPVGPFGRQGTAGTVKPVPSVVTGEMSYQEAFTQYKAVMAQYGADSPEALKARKVFQAVLQQYRQSE